MQEIGCALWWQFSCNSVLPEVIKEKWPNNVPYWLSECDQKGRYEICLLLCDSTVPYNHSFVLQRLNGLWIISGALIFSEKVYRTYGCPLCRETSQSSPWGSFSFDGKVWYQPQHRVVHPHKNNLRVVLNASTRFGGTSLERQLLSGPGCSSTVIGILVRFQ